MPSDPASAGERAAPFALGPGLRAAGFSPGRFATVIRRRLDGTHALQRVREVSSASFVLELDGGTARACRGWRYTMTNDGPEVHTEDRFREQAGFRGSYVERAGLIEVELSRDDGVCEPVAEYTYPPQRATTIRLECTMAAPEEHAFLTGTVLVCRWQGTPGPEREAHVVEGLGPAGVLVLGAAPGLEVAIEATPPGMTELGPPSLAVTVAPVTADAWDE
jgi:hypothetical protein